MNFYAGLKEMKNGKAPGCDGLTVRFYKRYWHILAQPLLNCLNESVELGLLPQSMRQSIIRLIPKKDKDKKVLKNWRPISLINVDCKIFSKLIANRLKIRLPKLIHPDQKAFVAGRQMHEGILNQRITVEHCIKHKIRGALVAIDFAKAFDSVEHSALWNSLKMFDFSDYLIKLAKTLCNKAFSAVINENFKLDDFPILRSCRQGDCVSPYLFVIVIESLLQRIRDSLPGITIKGIKNVVFGFADDLQVWVTNRNDIDKLLEILDDFADETGLRINADKCEVLNCGLQVDPDGKLAGFKLANEIKVTGVTLSHDTESSILLADETCALNKIKACVDDWNDRKLSLEGKIVLVKSKIHGILTHTMRHKLFSDENLKEIDKVVDKFLWKGPRLLDPPQIARPKNLGGLGLPRARQKNWATICQWIRTLRYGNELWCKH